MIEFKNVTKKYDNKTTALNDVNITIDKGEFVFVVGSSGAGKSTFLKLMMREEVPSSGTITVDGVNLNKIRKRHIPKFRRKLGIVFQDFRLIPTMTVFDNVAFAMRVIGTKEKKIRRRVPYLLSLMGLSEKSRNYPRELSGGEQQRIALARALANDAEIIIADEPTGNVDPQMSYEIVDLLMRLNESGVTVIMVTHEHSLVKCFNKRVIILEKGQVVSDGMMLDHDAATSHINPASEISSDYRVAPDEDYSVYQRNSQANSYVGEAVPTQADYVVPSQPAEYGNVDVPISRAPVQPVYEPSAEEISIEAIDSIENVSEVAPVVVAVDDIPLPAPVTPEEFASEMPQVNVNGGENND